MKLYFAPGACSLSPHIVLRESGTQFDLEQVNNQEKKTKSGVDYWTINPKGQVPVLEFDNGERLTEVGAFGLPDIYEAASTSLDLVVSQSLGAWAKGLELKLAGSNLLNEKREFLQAGLVQRSYVPGRKVSLSLSFSPF